MTSNDANDVQPGGASPVRRGPTAICPMAETCRRMSDKTYPKLVMTLPGLAFIALGVLIILVPALLVWMVALASIGLGIMILVAASFMVRIGEGMRRMRT